MIPVVDCLPSAMAITTVLRISIYYSIIFSLGLLNTSSTIAILHFTSSQYLWSLL